MHLIGADMQIVPMHINIQEESSELYVYPLQISMSTPMVRGNQGDTKVHPGNREHSTAIKYALWLKSFHSE